jgi:hypothetical protein
MTAVKKEPTVVEALIKAKTNFGPIVKDRLNPFHKSRYATLDSVNKAVDGPLMENGFIVSHHLGVRFGKLYLVSRLIHVSGEFDLDWQESICPIPDGLEPQKMGSAITYARRYNKLQLLDLVADEDDDGNASTTITKPQVQTLIGLAKTNGWSNEEVKELIQGLGFTEASSLTLSAYLSISEQLQLAKK